MGVSSSGVKTDALANYGTNAGTAATALGTVNPIYSKMASGTDGYTPQQKANELTASSESTGGGVASAVGQAGLLGARTGEAGAGAAALDDASRNAVAQNSGNALDVQNASDQLASKNQQIGVGGLNSIYQNSNGQADASLNTANNTQPSFLSRLATGALGAAGTVGGAYAGRRP